MNTLIGATEADISRFLSNLRESLLEEVRAGRPVVIGQEADTEPEPTGDAYGTPTDHRYMGTTFTIKVGRPARLEEEAFRRDRAAMALLRDSK